jgi:hypothetical protein
MPKLLKEVIAIAKASPRRYFAPLAGAIAAVQAEWAKGKPRS